jgi:uncharacterized protein (DUF4415 family)
MSERNPLPVVIVNLDGTTEIYPPAAPDAGPIFVPRDRSKELRHPSVPEPVTADATADEEIAPPVTAASDVAPARKEKLQPKAEPRLGDNLGVRRGPGRPKSAVPKRPVTMRIDLDVVEAFRAGGAGWQSRMNAVLRRHILGGQQAGDGRRVRRKLAKRSGLSQLAAAAKPAEPR